MVKMINLLKRFLPQRLKKPLRTPFSRKEIKSPKGPLRNFA